MPYAKRTRKRTGYRRKRRGYGKKRMYRRSNATSLRSLTTNTPLPRRFKTTLKYTDSISLNPGAGTLDSFVFNMASLYDPNYTGVGHQPMGFDQIMPLYDHFVVIGSKAVVTICGSGGFTVPTYVVANLCGAVTVPSSCEQAIEQNTSSSCILGQNNNVQRLNISYSPKKFLGISKPLSADKLQGTISANPTDGAFLVLSAQAVDGSSDPGVINLNVTIEYVAVFIEPLLLAQS